MKNAILSRFSSYSYTNNGRNEVFTETPPINSHLFPNDNSLCFYGDFSSDHAQIDLQNTVDSIIVTEYTSTSQLNYMPVQEQTFYQPWNTTFLQQTHNEVGVVQDARKRPAEAGTCSITNSGTNETERKKKRPTRLQGKLPKIQKEKEPTSRRRSQKLTDKITTLQKLVSPYGKTDTASVLLEASVSIQALQDQIEDMFRIISGEQTTNVTGEKGSDLQIRGLCILPSVVLEELDRRLPQYLL